ncbi:hypothetical protein [Candidatus Leptofilum sp.]|uniref:hypothetical protein n=1 Tax=Candidatus Leptofilum sp. TaxID=3241576 RepID=UPI003B5A741B
MIFGVYLFLSSLIFLPFFIKLSFSSQENRQERDKRHQLRVYIAKSFIFVMTGLTLFTLLSSWQGLLKFGVATDFSFPQDYIEAGLLGWFIMAIGLAGVLSPIFAGRTTN